MKPNSRRLNELADKEMHKKYLIAHNEYAVDDYKDGYQQAFDDLMAVVIMQSKYLGCTDSCKTKTHSEFVKCSCGADKALAESSKLLAELTEGNE